MTTAEPTISSALLQAKDYDVFHAVQSKQGFVGSSDVHEPLRFLLAKLEGAVPAGLKDLRVECTLHALGEQLGVCVASSHAARGEWNEWIFFPVTIAELPLDAVVCCTVHSPRGIVGGTTFFLFTSRGELKFGPRFYKVHPGVAADGSEQSTTLGRMPTADSGLLARDFALDRLRRVPWLDGLSQARAEEEAQSACRGEGALVLAVQMPASSSKLPIFHLSVPGDFDRDAHLFELRPGPFAPFYDAEMRAENLSESQAGVLSKSLHLIADADAQPAYKERRLLLAIINRPPIQIEGMKVDDAALMWQFRYFLSKHPKGFIPFMQCVDWENAAERQEASKLIKMWKPVPVEDALVLLSAQFRKIKVLREYAIGILQAEPVSTLSMILLQLVQAIRYDVEDELVEFLLERCVSHWDVCCNFYWYVSVEADMEAKSPNSASVKLWSRIDEEVGGRYSRIKQSLMDSLLSENGRFHQQLLKQEALRTVLTNLYTAVFKEKDRTKKINIVKRVIDEGGCGISELFSPLSSRVGEVMLPSHPDVAVYGIMSKGLYMFKSAKMPIKIPFKTTRDQLSVMAAGTEDRSNDDERDDRDAPSSTTDTEVSLNSTPLEQQQQQQQSATSAPNFDATGPSLSSTYAPAPPSEAFCVIFKSGDDVRQDQLVIQFIELMDSLLKSNGLDLCLTPYKVLATSQNDGFVEVVPDVDTFQNVQKESVARYIQKHNPGQHDFQRAMDRFVKSCAGYCVITYILGIGDRHLENLLITADGRLLHIDFGFIFGYDPKPFPPPMKINKEMVDAIGGINSEKYRQFKTYCCSAYNILRKHAALILQLLLLMIDASIPHISGDGTTDPRLGILKVQDKLRLDLNDAEATQFIQNVIADSVGALFTNLWDVIHEAAQAVRT